MGLRTAQREASDRRRRADQSAGDRRGRCGQSISRGHRRHRGQWNSSSIADAEVPLAQLQNRLLATTRGPMLAGLFEKYGAEVWNLIQTNRRVATIWHRCKGPIWYGSP